MFAVTDFSYHCTILIVKVNLHITVTITWQEDSAPPNDNICHGLFLYIAICFFFNKQLGCSAPRIDGIQIQFILMTIHGVYNYPMRVVGHLYSWHVAVII